MSAQLRRTPLPDAELHEGRGVQVQDQRRPSATQSERSIAITTDGTHIVYRVAAGGLAVRSTNDLAPTPLQGPGPSVIGPFISPEGAWVGYNDQGDHTIKNVPIVGGTPFTICKLGTGASVLGASWGAGETIVYGIDSKRVAFTSDRDGVENIYWQAADASGMAERLSDASSSPQLPNSFTKDARQLQINTSCMPPRRSAVRRAISTAPGGLATIETTVLSVRCGCASSLLGSRRTDVYHLSVTRTSLGIISNTRPGAILRGLS